MPLVISSPLISTTNSHLLTSLFAITYVSSLYISKSARLSFSAKARAVPNGAERSKLENERWRDDPDVIRARLAAVSIATVLCCTQVFFVMWHFGGQGGNNLSIALQTTIIRLGFPTRGMNFASIYPHLVTPILFLGPLYARYLDSALPLQRNWTFKGDFISTFYSWQGIRNYIMAPITEEVVFRACVLAVYHLSGASKTRMIFLSPLSFGVAHVHHAWDTYNRYGRTVSAAKRAIIMSLFQLSYTTLFGFHCSFLFLRTGSILPPISAHIFCNIMGVPQIGWELERFPKRRTAIIAAYILGIVGFVYTLTSWTLVHDSLYWRDGGVWISS